MFENYIMKKGYWREALPSMEAFAGAKEYEYLESAGSKVRAVHMYTGSGLDFWVYPGRGMDIGEACYQGAPISFVTKNGVKSGLRIKEEEFEKNFFAGLVTTCGLDNAGGACEVDGKYYPTHGRLNLTPAENYSVRTYWEDEKYFVECSGSVRISSLFGENMVLHRKIRIQAGESRIFLEDEIINEGYQKSGYMLLYHCNFGYPVVSDDSFVVSNHKRVEYLDEASKRIGRNAKDLSAPVPGLPQSAFLRHDVQGSRVKSAIINPELDLGVYLECNKEQLDCFCEWMNLASADYAVGLEPGKNGPDGRKKALEEDSIVWIEPGQIHRTSLEFGILSGSALQKYANEIVG